MRNVYLILFLFVLLVIMFGVTADQILAQNYAYEVEVLVENDTATAYTSKRVQIENFQAYYLIANGYLQADADDVYTANGEVCANTLGANDGTWFYTSVTNYPKYSSNILKIQIGNPTLTRDQVFPCTEEDYSRVWDDATLDIDASTGIQVSADALLYNSPVLTGTGVIGHILGKPGAYELYFNGTPEAVFRVFEPGIGIPGTETMNLDRACLHDGVENAPCITIGTFNQGIINYPTEQSGCNISLTVRAVARVNPAGGANPTIKVYLITDSGTLNQLNTITVDAAHVGWDGYFSTTTTMLNGENWTLYELWNRIASSRILTAGNANLEVSELFIYVNYLSQPGTLHQIKLPVTTGTAHAINGFYDNHELSITVDSVTNTTPLHVGVINTNNDYLILGKYDGYVNNVLVSTGSPAFANDELDLDMEPQNIDYNHIDDQSGNGNNCYFWLPDDGLDITFLGMASLGETSSLIPGAGVPGVLPPANITAPPEEREDGAGNPLYDLFLPFTQVSDDLGLGIDITMFWYMFYIGCIGLVTVFIARYIPDLRIIVIGTMIVTFVFWMWGPISIFIVILHFIITLFSLARETQRSPI